MQAIISLIYPNSKCRVLNSVRINNMKIYSMKEIYDFNGHYFIKIKENKLLEKRALFTKDQIELLVSREFACISFEK